MIRQAEKRDIPALKKLWEEAFGKEEMFEKDFFEHVFREKYVFCLETSGQIASMLYLLPCVLEKPGGEVKKAGYLYALATAAELRGQGRMSSLIAYALEEAERLGMKSLFLIPAEEGLISYYEKFGFTRAEQVRAGNMQLKTVQAEGADVTKLHFPSSVEEFCRRQAVWHKGEERLCVCALGEFGAVSGPVPM